MTRHGRAWAYAGAALGAVVSVAANVAHTYVPPAGRAGDWRPQSGAVIGSALWPILLLIALEITSKVAWPAGVRWHLLRWCGLLPVGAVAAIVSYRHMSGLLGWYGEDRVTCTIGPLAIDGLMVLAAGALLVRAPEPARMRAEPARIAEPARMPEQVRMRAEPARLRALPAGDKGAGHGVTARLPEPSRAAVVAEHLACADPSTRALAERLGVSQSQARRIVAEHKRAQSINAQ